MERAICLTEGINNMRGDLISRQAAIDAIKTSRYLVDAMEKIIRLPSAQPEIIRCKDCTYWHDSGKCDYFSIPERNIEVYMDKDGFCSEADRRGERTDG